MRCLLGLFVTVAFLPTISVAATMTERVEAAAKSGKYTYVMFYRANDAATQDMANTIKSHADVTDENTAWVTVDVRDRNEARLVRRFDASRIPLPAVFSVAPNGAITGVFRQTVKQEQLTDAILTPMYADMVKALQNQQIAVVCMMPAADTPTPIGVIALQQDPAFEGKLHQVTAHATDNAEAEFFRRMRVDQNLDAPVVFLFAPPGTHVGTFEATVSGHELAQKLHKSGKCNCSKCQHK
ncbi:MAG: hypothetical protein WBF93_02255 [Pirellulales bacterium]